MKRIANRLGMTFRGEAGSPFLFVVFSMATALLLWGGLSVRSLWGPEGRWAVIVKEMLQSGNYFLPTINGSVYFDKPLLSYWAMLLFARFGGLNEAMLRLPATLAGAGTIVVVFLIGRRLFGRSAGLLSAAYLLTASMFLFWSRTASAEVMNTFAIVVMFWLFLVSRFDDRPRLLPLFYIVAAAASFIKGPVAPAVCLFAVTFVSVAETAVRYREARFANHLLPGIARREFFWLLSRPALVGIACGLVVFAAILLLPVALSGGSWLSVSLMWKENVVRFLSPFDHKDPPYAYIVSILQFSAPWTFVTLAAIWQAKRWRPGMDRRWLLACTAGVLLFFLLSGSRRSYYILPFIPFLALIAGKSTADWIGGAARRADRAMQVGVLATAGLLACVGGSILYVYLRMPAYRHASEPIMALLILAGAVVSFLMAVRHRRAKALCTLFVAFFAMDLWGFTIGMEIAERERTLKGFAQQASVLIDKAGDRNIALFHETTAEVVFYLGRSSALTQVASVEEIDRFAREHDNPLLLIDTNDMPGTISERVEKGTTVLIQKTGERKRGERFALIDLRTPAGP